jgi:DNA-binding transcriptional LysR family regulator
MHWADRIVRRLRPRDLHIFLTVVEQGNMANAANFLATSRPVVSKTIAGLERTLGVPLLDRNPQGAEPTLYGRALIKRSIALLDDLRQGVQEIKFLADPTAGELRLGCAEAIVTGFVPAIIDRLSRKYPQLVFHLQIGNTVMLQMRDLRERNVELVVARMLSRVPEPDMEARVLFYEQMFVVAGTRNKWVDRRKIVLTELIHEPWILAPLEIETGSPVVRAFRAVGSELPRATVVVSSSSLRNVLLGTGRFITVVPGSVLRLGIERSLLKILPIELPPWQLPVSIITLKNRTLSPIAQLFIDYAREVAKALAKGQYH